ncbi:hypothetical protein [Vampirovibrio sp.]|uniref:hypothetical protein n=1 Tax=Vampirovibrio sp. TaxID=2717857 RepID=UPI00359309B2
MTSQSPKLEDPKPVAKRKKFSQERLMTMFTLFFVLGILLLVVIPEGSPVRGIAMTIYSITVFWAMFKFCI